MRRLLRPALTVLAVAIVFRVDPALGVVAVLAGWAWSSWYLPKWALDGVIAERAMPERALFGEPVELRLTVSSQRSLPWMRLTDAMPFELGSSVRWATGLDPGGRRSHTTRFDATARGLHAVGPAVAVTGDVFGLRRVQRVIVPRQRILVYPRIVPMETLTIAAGSPLPIVPTTTPLFDDPTRIVGVREYQPGDPFKKIHWTASAALGSLVVKKHRPGIARDVVLAVDLTRDSHPAPGRRRSAEIAVTTAASIAHHLATVRSEAIGLRIVGRDTPTGSDTVTDVAPGRDSARIARVLERLARADLSATAPIEALLDPNGLPFGASVVLLTGVPARSHVADCLRLRRLGLSVTVIGSAGERHASPWAGSLREHGIAVISVASLADLVGL